MKPGERVILVDRRGKTYMVRAGSGEFHTDLGVLNLDELLNLKYGDTIKSHRGEVFRIIKPRLTDIIRKMRRGPQIVHPKDAGVIIAYAGISNGDFIVEAGAGSGALTMFLAEAVGESGRVVSYEKREDFAEIARKNIEMAGLADRVTIKVKDIYEGIDEESVDHVILDLPQPERVLPHAVRCLKPGGYFVAYTPCMNQVQRFYSHLNEYSDEFMKPLTVDVMAIEHEVKKECIRPKTKMLVHTGYITFLRKL